MITRIKYTKNQNLLSTEVFVINADLAVFVEINTDTLELVLKCGTTKKSKYVEICPSIVSAKYKARKMLIKMGMNFNTEFRRKNASK